MPMRYALGTYINAGTLSVPNAGVSTEDTPFYGKENMYGKNQALPWRMNAKSGYAIWDLGSYRPTCLAILNHNLEGTGAFVLTLKTAATFAGLAGATPENVSWHKQNIWHTMVTTPNRWWRLDIDDPDCEANLEFGEIVLYTYGTFSMNYWWPYKEGIDYVVDENVTHYGHRHRVRRAKKKIFALDFEGVRDSPLESEVEAFFEALNGDSPFVFLPDSVRTDCWYVWCLNSLEATRNFINYNKFFLRLEEQARGIILR